MKTFSRITLWAAVLGLLALPGSLLAAGGYAVADTAPGMDFPTVCDGSSFLTPSDGGSLFQLRSTDTNNSKPAENDILWDILNGTSVGPGAGSCVWQEDSGFGSYQCFNNNHTPQPGAGQTVWDIITVYPASVPMTDHEGWFLIDNSPGADSTATRQMAPQRVRVPVVRAVADTAGTGNTLGFEVAFEYPTEFSSAPAIGNCYVGGDATSTPTFDERIFLGWNVYALNTADVAPNASTPIHYLCGPDQDCSTAADNGWVGFIPLDPSVAGLTVDDPAQVTTDSASWPAGVEQRSDTNPDVLFLFQPADLTAEYSVVVQPVLRVNNLGNLTDWNGMKVLDLNGDGQPEFVDPSGNGLGLTANGTTAGTNPIILISREAVANGAGATPVLGSVDLSASIDRRSGGVNLTFLSSIEGDVVGFNVFRSTDNGTSFVRVNDKMLSAKGAPLTNYTFTDTTLDVRRIRAGKLLYRVQAVLADGSMPTYGPYTVDLGNVPTPRPSRSR